MRFIKGSNGGVQFIKDYLGAMLHCLYVKGIADAKMGGFGWIFEADEALIGKKPTYSHGKINKIFKMWVLGVRLRTSQHAIPQTVFKVLKELNKL